MVNCNLYDARVTAKRLLDNMAEEEIIFLQGSAFLLLALVIKDQIRNETEFVFKNCYPSIRFLVFVLILFSVSVI